MTILENIGNLGGGFGGNTPTHIKEGYMIGWHIGQITSLEDPEGLGRIQAKLIEVDPNLNIPNEEDCMVWTGTRMTLSGLAGGTHEPLGLDSLIAMIPKGGDPKQMLMICCLNNRVDRPHPELNRHYGRYGMSTVNEVFDFWDDSNQSRVQAWPHGVTKTITPQGDIQNETLGGARTLLRQDGTVLMENPKAGVAMSKEGDITQSNFSAATVNLSKTGEITVGTPFATKLELKKDVSKLYGPKSLLGQLFSVVSDIFGPKASGAMESLANLKNVKTGNNVVTAAINQSRYFLEELESSMGESLKMGIQALDSILQVNIKEFVDVMEMQIANVLGSNIPAATKKIEEAIDLEGSISEETATILEEMLSKQLAENLGKAKTDGKIKDLEQTLAHNPEKLKEALIDLVVGDSVPGASSLQQMNLLRQIDEIKDQLLLPFDLNDPNTLNLVTPQQLDAILEARRDNIRELWPDATQNLLTDSMINNAFKAGDPAAYLVAHLQQAIIKDTKGKLVKAAPQVELITPTLDLVQGLETGNLNQIYGATTNAPQLSELLGDATLGDLPVAQLGGIDVSHVTVGKLLGDYNPGTIDLTALDSNSLLQYLPTDNLNVAIAQAGTIINIGQILETLHLPTINLAEVLGLDEGVLNIEELSLSKLLGEAIDLKTLHSLDLSTIGLEDFLTSVDLSSINVKSLLSSLDLSSISLSDALKATGIDLGHTFLSQIEQKNVSLQSVVDLIDGNLSTDLSKINLPSMLGGIDLSEVNLSKLNLDLDVGKILPSQLEEVFNRAIDPLIGELQGLLEGALTGMNPMLGAVMDLIGGAKVVLGQAGGSLESMKGTHRVYASDAMAAVESLVGGHAVFATKATAGLKAAKGILGFGDGGGGMVSFGNVAMRAMKQIASPEPEKDEGRPYGWSAGMQLSPEKGVTIGSYLGYGPSSWDGNDYEKMSYSDELIDPVAFVNVNQERVSMRSSDQRYGLDINNDGVWINNVHVLDYIYGLNRRLEDVHALALANQAALSALSTAMTTSPTSTTTSSPSS